jgi:PmbA protein
MMSEPSAPRPDAGYVDEAIERCLTRGFDAAQVRVADQQLHELQAEYGEPALLRTVADTDVTLVGLVDGKRGSLSLNRKDHDTLGRAVEELWQLASGSLPDEANAIAEFQPAGSFAFGPEQPDYEAMYASLDGLLDYTREAYPLITLGSASIRFYGQAAMFGNSNGLRMDCTSASYGGQLMFTARDGQDVSSFNYSGFVADRLDVPFKDHGTTDELLRQTSEQVRTRKIPEKFHGDLIITPDALGDFLGFLLTSIGNAPLIAGTSIYRGRLGEQVAAGALTVRSCPVSLPGGYRVSSDGLPVEDTVVVEAGVLRSYLLNLYGSRKTGLPLARTDGGCIVVDAGTKPLDEIIASTRRGVLITRFSGGRPSEKGDFSGVAKNSYYVADGAVQYPVSEVMVSGNLADLLLSVDAVSAERADFGYSVAPWVRAAGVGIS